VVTGLKKTVQFSLQNSKHEFKQNRANRSGKPLNFTDLSLGFTSLSIASPRPAPYPTLVVRRHPPWSPPWCRSRAGQTCCQTCSATSATGSTSSGTPARGVRAQRGDAHSRRPRQPSSSSPPTPSCAIKPRPFPRGVHLSSPPSSLAAAASVPAKVGSCSSLKDHVHPSGQRPCPSSSTPLLQLRSSFHR
jgi:hypothetical protein